MTDEAKDQAVSSTMKSLLARYCYYLYLIIIITVTGISIFICIFYYYYCFFWPTSTKAQAEILKLNKVNGCNDFSFGGHCVLIGDRIPPLESHGQALEQKYCFPAVFCDDCDAPANLLSHFYGCFMTCTRRLDGKRAEDVIAIIVLFLSCLFFIIYNYVVLLWWWCCCSCYY